MARRTAGSLTPPARSTRVLKADRALFAAVTQIGQRLRQRAEKRVCSRGLEPSGPSLPIREGSLPSATAFPG
ncbi:hypothetical protein DFR50_13926 [Roseiarcus fermentans]|uniref:Uncharacterized protein n=1 Tax=Roseiarcus fermentans TaxID=1473586 RepID=A0A366ESQ3_9HYPH|nr:hypothetical protein DFR50_13926 [Roseiarcus fermentans]